VAARPDASRLDDRRSLDDNVRDPDSERFRHGRRRRGVSATSAGVATARPAGRGIATARPAERGIATARPAGAGQRDGAPSRAGQRDDSAPSRAGQRDDSAPRHSGAPRIAYPGAAWDLG
jgi:hypothetical protein